MPVFRTLSARKSIPTLTQGTRTSITGVGPRAQWLLVQVAGMGDPVWVLCDLIKIIGSLAGDDQF